MALLATGESPFAAAGETIRARPPAAFGSAESATRFATTVAAGGAGAAAETGTTARSPAAANVSAGAASGVATAASPTVLPGKPIQVTETLTNTGGGTLTGASLDLPARSGFQVTPASADGNPVRFEVTIICAIRDDYAICAYAVGPQVSLGRLVTHPTEARLALALWADPDLNGVRWKGQRLP